MIPIAVRIGEVWWNRFPFDEDSGRELQPPPLPAPVDRVPKDWLPPDTHLPSTWTLQRRSGARIQITATQLIKTHRMENDVVVGLQSDAPASVDSACGGDEMAFTGEGTPGRFIAPSQQERNNILRQLKDKLAALEQAELARYAKTLPPEPGSDPIVLTRTRTAVPGSCHDERL
jgi:hypothetical protein